MVTTDATGIIYYITIGQLQAYAHSLWLKI